jgi:hypothetical protein
VAAIGKISSSEYAIDRRLSRFTWMPAAAQDTLVGIELMHMIKKRQLVVEEEDEGRTAAKLFYSLAA